jgi:integrase
MSGKVRPSRHLQGSRPRDRASLARAVARRRGPPPEDPRTAWVKDSGKRTPRGAVVWRAGNGPKPDPSYLTPADAADQLRMILAGAPRATTTGRGRGPTFAAVAMEWLEHGERKRGLKHSTLKDYRYLLRNHLVPAFGDRPLRAITRQEIERWHAGYERTRTAGQVLMVLGAILRYARRRELIAANPIDGVERHPVRYSGDYDMYSREEIDAIVRCAADDQDAAIILAAALTGLRRGELLALRWRDIDFAGQAIRVRGNLSYGQIVTPKSGKVRVVPMVDEVAVCLARLAGRFTRCATSSAPWPRTRPRSSRYRRGWATPTSRRPPATSTTARNATMLHFSRTPSDRPSPRRPRRNPATGDAISGNRTRRRAAEAAAHGPHAGARARRSPGSRARRKAVPSHAASLHDVRSAAANDSILTRRPTRRPSPAPPRRSSHPPPSFCSSLGRFASTACIPLALALAMRLPTPPTHPLSPRHRYSARRLAAPSAALISPSTACSFVCALLLPTSRSPPLSFSLNSASQSTPSSTNSRRPACRPATGRHAPAGRGCARRSPGRGHRGRFGAIAGLTRLFARPAHFSCSSKAAVAAGARTLGRWRAGGPQEDRALLAHGTVWMSPYQGDRYFEYGVLDRA